MKHGIVCLVGLLVLVGSVGHSSAGRTAHYPPKATVAIVNGEKITVAEFGEKLVTELGFSVIDDMVRRKLVLQEAQRLGVTVTSAELAARRKLEADLRLRHAAATVRLTFGDLAQYLKQDGRTLDQEKADIEKAIPESALRIQTLAEKICSKKVMLTDMDLEEYYAKTRGMRFLAAQIVVRNRGQADALAGLLTRRRAGMLQNTFAQMVKSASLDRDSVPWEGRMQPIVPDSYFGNVLKRMQPNELKVIKDSSHDYWHLLKLLKRVPPDGPPLAKVREQLHRELLVLKTSPEIDRWVLSLVRSADIFYNLSDDAIDRRVLGEDVVVYVNGEPIYRHELADALLEQYGDRAIDELINEMVVFQYAARRHMNISTEEVGKRVNEMIDEKIEELAKQRKRTVPEFYQDLRTHGIDIDRYRRTVKSLFISRSRVRAFIISRDVALQSVKVTDADVKQEYQTRYGKKKYVLDLTVESRNKADQIRRELIQGADFEELLRTHGLGLDTSGDTLRKGPIVPGDDYWPIVKDLKDGVTTDIFQTSDGFFHILRVVEVAPNEEPPALDQVKDKLAADIKNRRMNLWMRVWLKDLRKRAKIEKTPLAKLEK